MGAFGSEAEAMNEDTKHILERERLKDEVVEAAKMWRKRHQQINATTYTAGNRMAAQKECHGGLIAAIEAILKYEAEQEMKEE